MTTQSADDAWSELQWTLLGFLDAARSVTRERGDSVGYWIPETDQNEDDLKAMAVTCRRAVHRAWETHTAAMHQRGVPSLLMSLDQLADSSRPQLGTHVLLEVATAAGVKHDLLVEGRWTPQPDARADFLRRCTSRFGADVPSWWPKVPLDPTPKKVFDVLRGLKPGDGKTSDEIADALAPMGVTCDEATVRLRYIPLLLLAGVPVKRREGTKRKPYFIERTNV